MILTANSGSALAAVYFSQDGGASFEKAKAPLAWTTTGFGKVFVESGCFFIGDVSTSGNDDFIHSIIL
jgi:hypothetical protein